MSLTERAEKLTDDVQRALSSPGAMMVPGAVKAIIQQQGHLIEDMARAIDELKGRQNED